MFKPLQSFSRYTINLAAIIILPHKGAEKVDTNILAAIPTKVCLNPYKASPDIPSPGSSHHPTTKGAEKLGTNILRAILGL